MDRSERNGVLRYDVRRRGLPALLLLAAVPWALAGALGAEPGLFGAAGFFLLAAMAAALPRRSLFIDRGAGTLLVVCRTWGWPRLRQTLPLSSLKRRPGEAGWVVELREGGTLRLPASERLAEDLSAPS